MVAVFEGRRDRPMILGEVDGHGERWGFAVFDRNRQEVARLTYSGKPGATRAWLLMREAMDDAVVAPEISRAAAVATIDQTTHPHTPHESSVRSWVHTVLEEGQSESFVGRVVEGLLIVLIVLNVVAVALETIPSFAARHHGLLRGFEELSLAAYTLEYALRVWSSVEDPRVAMTGGVRGRIAFALRPLMVVDFLAFAPSIIGIFFGIDLRVLRIFRLFRLLKLARYSQALQALLNVLFIERSALLASLILLLAFTCLFGELMHLAEGSLQPNTLGTMPGAMYWAITTLATVGYGDITPQTPLGKLIAGMTMVAGLAIFALPVGIIANGFVSGLSHRRFAITWTMLRRQPLFRGFDVDSLTDVMEVPSASIVREHAHLIVEGAGASEFFLVISGEACAECDGAERSLGPGDMIGQEALDHGASYGRTVTALTAMRVIVFPADELRRLCRKYPLLRERISTSLGHEFPVDYAAASGIRRADIEAENAKLKAALADIVLGHIEVKAGIGIPTP